MLLGLFLIFEAPGCKKSTSSASNTTNPIEPAIPPAQLVQQRLAWNLKTLVEPYELAGHKNPKWDGPAKLALSEFARCRSMIFGTNEPWAEIISTNAAAAVGEGCSDPMVNYLYVKFALNQTNSSKTFCAAYYKVAMDLQNSSYPSIRRFYAAQRAVDQLFYTYGYGDSNIYMKDPIYVDVMPLIGPNLLAALNDKTMPALEAFEACDAGLAAIKGEGIPDYAAYSQAYHCVEGPIFENWPNAYSSWLLKGEAYVQLAWAARGIGLANTVTPEGWKTFNDRLAVAENALTNAWQLNPNDSRIADHMLEVELGQGKDRDRMELWFNRAISLNACDYDACKAKLNYLQPKWYGSIDDMLQFGRECATNTQWGGNVPLILLDAHYFISYMYTNQTDRTNYWKQPEVWPDLQMAFERFFKANPGATGRSHQYASYAYQCDQWAKFIELMPELQPVNYDYFGGKDKFDEMVRLAKEHIRSP